MTGLTHVASSSACGSTRGNAGTTSNAGGIAAKGNAATGFADTAEGDAADVAVAGADSPTPSCASASGLPSFFSIVSSLAVKAAIASCRPALGAEMCDDDA